MSSQFETFKCTKCFKNVPTINKVIHLAQCKGGELRCSKCGLEVNINEYDDHLLCHSIESQEENLQEDYTQEENPQEDNPQEEYSPNRNPSK